MTARRSLVKPERFKFCRLTRVTKGRRDKPTEDHRKKHLHTQVLQSHNFRHTMKYSDVVFSDREPSREESILQRLDSFNPVEVDEHRVCRALEEISKHYPAEQDHITLEDCGYSSYKERFAEPIGNIELLLVADRPHQWCLLVCRRENGEPAFYCWSHCLLYFVGNNWLDAFHGFHELMGNIGKEVGNIRHIPLKEGLTAW
jgi:hypothetical protein